MSQNTPTPLDRKAAMEYAVRLVTGPNPAAWTSDTLIATAKDIANFLAGADGKADQK